MATHQINETLFRELENRFLIVEGDDIRLFEDNGVNANDMIVAMLKQNGYDISINYRAENDDLAQVIQEVKAIGRNIYRSYSHS